jgi:hypothetical protein
MINSIYGIESPTLDHLAIIDLPGPNTGIPIMREILEPLGFNLRGSDYLPEKQNGFYWFAEEGLARMPAQNSLPQIILADFCLKDLSSEMSQLVLKYSTQAPKAPIAQVVELSRLARNGRASAAFELIEIVSSYFNKRDWNLPTYADFHLAKESNELISWVMVFGRIVNHFGLSVHLRPDTKDLSTFNNEIIKSGLRFNEMNGRIIKGQPSEFLEQSAIRAGSLAINLTDGSKIEIQNRFIELVWRHKITHLNTSLWENYYADFVGRNATNVVESLYTEVPLVVN